MLCCKKHKIKNNTKQKPYCIICMDESKKSKPHGCKICNKKAWFICDDCNNQLTTCPICRTSFNKQNRIINPINILVNSNNSIEVNRRVSINRRRSMNNIILKIRRYKITSPFCQRLKKCLLIMLKTIVSLICIIYLGKILVFLYCRFDCIDMEKKDECYCYNITQPPEKFWHIFNSFPVSFTVGWLSCLAIISCFGCCTEDRSRLPR